jgi:MFS family permease
MSTFGRSFHVKPNKLLQVSVYYLGTLVGCLIGGWVGDKIGRVRTIAFGAAWAILGAALQCSAQNHIWMIFARLINGWGTGVLVSIVFARTNRFGCKLMVAA